MTSEPILPVSFLRNHKIFYKLFKNDLPSADSKRNVVSNLRKNVRWALVNCLDLSLSTKREVRSTVNWPSRHEHSCLAWALNNNTTSHTPFSVLLTFEGKWRNFVSDRHRSFKLRLPSIRRDIRFKSKAVESSQDPENPPIREIPEEAVPLNQLLGTETLLPINSSPNKSPERFIRSENTYSEVLNETENNSLQLPSVTIVRRASSLEGLDLKSQEKYDKLGQGDAGKACYTVWSWNFHNSTRGKL